MKLMRIALLGSLFLFVGILGYQMVAVQAEDVATSDEAATMVDTTAAAVDEAAAAVETASETTEAMVDAAAASAITQDMITIETPKKKDTHVVFDHKVHSEREPQKCAACHPALAPEVGAEANTMKVVHDTCKTCHAKTGEASAKAGCDDCHTAVE